MDREQTQSVAAAWLRERWKVGAALAAVLGVYLAVYLLIDVAGIGEYLSFGAAVGLCALLLAAAALCLKPCFISQ